MIQDYYRGLGFCSGGRALVGTGLGCELLPPWRDGNPAPGAAIFGPRHNRLMRLWWLLPVLSVSAQTTVGVRPELITRCNAGGLGKARIVWESSGPGRVEVRVGSAGGPPMTGLEPPTGSAETGEWVVDGTGFVLVDELGRELARDRAHVRCSPGGTTLSDAMASGDYLPLEVGNEWVYRVNNRVSTGAYIVRRVVRTETIGGKAWYVLSQTATNAQPGAEETYYRTDPRGRVFRRADGAEELWLDPTTPPDPAARLTVERRGMPFSNPLGSFNDSLIYTAYPSIVIERGVFVRGLGLASSESTMISGSSGGFLESLDLVYARLGENLVFSTHAAGLELLAESLDLDVSGRAVVNCAVPCYFTACGLAPGTDPPGTYKPCFQARVRVDAPTASTAKLALAISDPSGGEVFAETGPVPPGQPGAVLFRQLPLFTAPNQPFPTGRYVLRARLLSESGTESASATVSLQVR